MYQLERTTQIDAALPDVFRLFSRPENLNALTPPWMKMEILTPSPIPMQVGTAIDYTVRMRGFPLRWTALIAEYDPPYRFVDLQLRGPYSFWHHLHLFEPAENGTRIIDLVRYALPWGPLGRIAHALIVHKDLERIFDYRQNILKGIDFETLDENPDIVCMPHETSGP
jgi:ligand-binding SRPBCC domain-containing protein